MDLASDSIGGSRIFPDRSQPQTEHEHMIGHICTENLMKMKETGLQWGGGGEGATDLIGPLTEFFNLVVFCAYDFLFRIRMR